MTTRKMTTRIDPKTEKELGTAIGAAAFKNLVFPVIPEDMTVEIPESFKKQFDLSFEKALLKMVYPQCVARIMVED